MKKTSDLISKSRLKNELSKIPSEMGLIKKAQVIQAIDKQKTQDSRHTNADIIRNMSDEELASWYVIKCEIMMGIKCQKPYKTCKDCIFEWLQSEAE